MLATFSQKFFTRGRYPDEKNLMQKFYDNMISNEKKKSLLRQAGIRYCRYPGTKEVCLPVIL